METSFVRRNYGRMRRRVIITVLLIVGIFIAGILLITENMQSAMLAIAEARIKSVTTRAMNDAILACMDENGKYSDIIQVYEDGSNVYLLQANTRNMNILATDCSLFAQERIAELGEQGISVALGTITGIPFLSGKGPSIRVSFTPVGSVQSGFNSEFTSAGINQTLYRVNLTLTASVKLVMPGISETVKVYAEAAIAETILVGDVPQTYANLADTGNFLNLVPKE